MITLDRTKGKVNKRLISVLSSFLPPHIFIFLPSFLLSFLPSFLPSPLLCSPLLCSPIISIHSTPLHSYHLLVLFFSSTRLLTIRLSELFVLFFSPYISPDIPTPYFLFGRFWIDGWVGVWVCCFSFVCVCFLLKNEDFNH